MSEVVLLDMDRTTFNTEAFMSDVKEELEVTFNVNLATFNNTMAQFRIPGQEGLRHYDFFGHVQYLGLNAEEVESHIGNTLQQDYSYPDVSLFLDFLSEEVEVAELGLLTYGEQRFQKLKCNAAPALNNVAFTSVLEPKGGFIKRRYGDQKGIIIDDREISGLPPTFQHFWLVRGTPTPDGAYNSLESVRTIWQNQAA